MSTPADFKKNENRNGYNGRKEGGNHRQMVQERKQPPRKPYPPRINHCDFTMDMAGGRQYTSFDGLMNNNNVYKPPQQQFVPRPRPAPSFPRAPPPPPASTPVAADPPIDLDTYDIKINPAALVCFNGRSHYLSNLYPVKLEIDGQVYSSVEHYYQATKLFMLAGPAIAGELRNIDDPGAVKSAARRLLRGKVSDKAVDEWKKEQAPPILLHAIKLKFRQHKQLWDKLMATADAVLAHTYDRDNYFATGCNVAEVKKWAEDHANEILKIPVNAHTSAGSEFVPVVGRGKNILGAICMVARMQLRDEENDPLMKIGSLSLN